MAGFAHTIESLLKNTKLQGDYPFFVETGTFVGKTTKIASEIFDKVYTIELSSKLHREAAERFKNHKNIVCLVGNSPAVLKDLLPKLNANTVFFLDAHWAGDLSVRSSEESPLLEEIKVLAQRNNYKDIIIIDDVSFFGREGEIFFPKGSQYFPNGGIFHWNWKDINKQKILDLFPNKKVLEKDDRLIIET